jgi:epoxyqueuosine reductase
VPESEVFNSHISSFLQEREVSLFGFADLSSIPNENRYGFPRSISFAFPISKEIIQQIRSGPTQEYYFAYNRLNSRIAQTAKEIEEYIFSLGYDALAINDDNRKYDKQSLSTILPYKTSATLAGLGWIGKCALLVSEIFGSGIRLGTVLTDVPIETGTAITKSNCGDCEICVQLCPAKAITGKNWVRGIEREELYDAFACQATAKRLSGSVGVDHSICGICIANCPRTMRYVNRPVEKQEL